MQKAAGTTAVLIGLALTVISARADTTNDLAIEERKATFEELKATVANVKDAMKAEDFEAASAAAEIIIGNSEQLKDLFPLNSYEGDTRAKKKIWENWEDFQARQNQLLASAEQLLLASQSGNPEQLKKSFKTLSKDCKGCHRKYRQIF